MIREGDLLQDAAEADNLSQEHNRIYYDTFKYSINGLCIHKMMYDRNGAAYDCKYLMVNKAFETHTGLSADDLIGKTIRELYPGNEADDIIQLYGEALASGVPEQTEIFFKPTDCWYEISVFSIMNGTGEFTVVVNNITERKRAEEKHVNQKQYLQTILRTSPDGFWVVDINKNIQQANDAYSRMSGYSAKELQNMQINEIDAIEESEDTQARIERIIKNGFEVFETRHRRKDGSVFDVEMSTTFMDVDGGQLVCFCRDITERKQAEMALRESEEKLKDILNNTTDIVWSITYPDFKPLFISSAAEQIYGYPVQQLIDNPMFFSEIVHPDDQHTLGHALDQLTSHGASTRECRIIRSDGQIRHIHDRNRIIYDQNNQPVRVDGITSDITERKQVEMAQHESEVRARSQRKAIADLSLNEEVLEGELSGALDMIMETVAKAMNIARAGIWMLPDDRSELRCLSLYEAELARHSRGMVLKTETFPRYFEAILSESRIRAHDSQTDPRTSELSEGYLVPLNITSMLDAGIQIEGRLAGVVCLEHIGEPRQWHSDEEAFVSTTAALVAQVMTNARRRLVEEERQKLQAQLVQATKMQTIGRLAGGVAHDFNNMLGVILGYTEMALSLVKPEQPLHTYLEEVQKAAQRSADLTQQLLAFARKQTISPKILDLNVTIEGMLKMLRQLIGENINLQWEPANNLWSVKMDPSQIDQILANLCVNARDAIGGVGKIIIETGMVSPDDSYCATHLDFVIGDFVRLVVSDNGCGMDKDTLSNIFEPFFTTKDVGKGTGMGLPTIYGIVKQNNGFINVYSEPGEGTTFTIYLPKHQTLTESSPKPDSIQAVARGTETILLVEDEPVLLQMIKEMLEILGYCVLTANCPSDAMGLAKTYDGDIHLLMTDVIMPEMNGRALSNHLSSLYPNLKSLFMSGYTANVIAHHGVLDKNLYFIQKPFAMKDLGAKVRDVLMNNL